MADNRSVTITLKLDKSSESQTDTTEQTGSVSVEGASASTPSSSNSSGGDSGATAKAAYAAMAVQAAQIAINEGVAWAEYYWNRELSLTDDYVAQRNKQIATTQINRAISYASTIGTFTALGAKAGPVGAAIGALLGSAIVGSQIARSNIQGKDQQDIELGRMYTQLSFTRSRAGWSTKAASIGEDL